MASRETIASIMSYARMRLGRQATAVTNNGYMNDDREVVICTILGQSAVCSHADVDALADTLHEQFPANAII